MTSTITPTITPFPVVDVGGEPGRTWTPGSGTEPGPAAFPTPDRRGFASADTAS